jgi:hypothetical protein
MYMKVVISSFFVHKAPYVSLPFSFDMRAGTIVVKTASVSSGLLEGKYTFREESVKSIT